MNKFAFVNMVKASFRKTLQDSGVSAQEFATSDRGAALIKRAEEIIKEADSGVPMSAIAKQFFSLAKDHPGATAGLGAIGGAMAGLGAGKVVSDLTSPPEASIASLQKKELIQAYDEAIEETQRRMQVRKARGAL